jgi:integrase
VRHGCENGARVDLAGTAPRYLRGNPAAHPYRHGGARSDACQRNKTKVDLLRPLSKAAVAVLPADDGCKYVFSTDGKNPISGWSKFKVAFDKAVLAELRKQDPEAKALPDWTLHDLRRTARTLMSRAGVNTDIAERCLGHVIGGVRGVYDRYEYRDEKAAAYEALANLIARIVNPPAGNVEAIEEHRTRRRTGL